MKMFTSGAMLLLSPLTILAGPCLPGNLQSYLDLGSTGCEIGTTLFTNFTLWPSGFPTLMDPLVVNITPAGSASQPKLITTPNYVASGPDQSYGLLFHFLVHGQLTGTSLAFQEPLTSGQGATYAYLDVCSGGFFTFAPFGCGPPAPPFLSARAGLGNDKLTSSMELPDAAFYHVSLHLYLVSNGGISDSAALGSATMSFNTVPEAGAAPLMAVFLAAIVIHSKFRNSQSGL